MLRKRELQAGGVIPEDQFHEQLRKGRHAATLAWLRTSRNTWALATFVALFVSILVSFGWHAADKRFAENVRVEWVKLSPDGTYTVDYAEENKPVEYFAATVESKLSEWAEKRYSKLRSTISTDYGFANLMMSPQLSTDFMDSFHAAKVAAEHVACKECGDTEVKVRNVQPIDKDVIPGTKSDQLFTTLVFIREREITKDGQVANCRNKILTVLWKFRPREEIVSRRQQLRYNPLGMEINRASERDDPTPVSAEDCAKR